MHTTDENCSEQGVQILRGGDRGRNQMILIRRMLNKVKETKKDSLTKYKGSTNKKEQK